MYTVQGLCAMFNTLKFACYKNMTRCAHMHTHICTLDNVKDLNEKGHIKDTAYPSIYDIHVR